MQSTSGDEKCEVQGCSGCSQPCPLRLSPLEPPQHHHRKPHRTGGTHFSHLHLHPSSYKKKDGDESEEEEAPEDEGEVDFVRRLRKRHAKTQRRVLEMYRRATSLVYGVSQITLHSNATKVEVALEGLDLFAELP